MGSKWLTRESLMLMKDRGPVLFFTTRTGKTPIAHKMTTSPRRTTRCAHGGRVGYFGTLLFLLLILPRSVFALDVFYAASQGRTDLVLSFFIKHPDMLNSVTNLHGAGTVLHIACEQGHTTLAKGLLQLGADTEVRDLRYGQTAIFRAAYRGHEDIVKLLIQYKAKLDVVDKIVGLSPLHMAAERNFAGIVEIILKNSKGHTVDIKDRSDATPLFLACSKGAFQTALLLVQKGANLYAPRKGIFFGSSLHLDSSPFSKEQKAYLVDRYNAAVKTQNGFSPLRSAKKVLLKLFEKFSRNQQL